MAAVYYRYCDLCGEKTFYDAELGWCDDPELPLVRYANPDNEQGGRLWRLGDWAVLCTDCSKTHETRIVKKEST